MQAEAYHTLEAHYNDHSGVPLEAGRQFIGLPPEEIGRVQTAFSTMRMGEMKTFVKRSLIIFIVACLPLIIGSITLLVLGQERLGPDSIMYWFFVFFLGGLCALIGLFQLNQHECSYVGEKGFARLSFPGPLSRFLSKKKSGTYTFDQFRALYVNSTRQYINSIYGGTSASFTWVDADGKVVFRLDSSYYSYKEKPHRDRTVHFGRSAEMAWTNYVLPKHLDELNRLGKTGFPFERGGGIFLSRTQITVRRGKEETNIPLDWIQSVQVESGLLCIFRQGDKGGLLGKGPYTITYGEIGNALALLQLIQIVRQNSV
jgi:hypothetical protein